MRTILVVDDKAENIRLMQALFRASGFAVRSASQGEEALAVARNSPPDLVISDVLMPVMDGFNLCREWKNDPKLSAIPFVFYSATYTDEKDRAFAMRQGADLFIEKPTELREILKIVKKLLEDAVQRTSTVENIVQSEPVYLKEYNAVLVRKLVDKVEELERRNTELARKERMKSNFLVVAAHELHTPMACVMGYAQLLEKQLDSGIMRGLCRGMERLNRVTRTIIEMSRAEADELPMQHIVVDLNGLVGERIEGFRAFLAHRRQSLVLERSSETLTARGDPEELGQAFENLVLNAIRFTPDEGCVTVRTAATVGGSSISVADTGIGIPQEDCDRIFERFVQLKDCRTHHSGTIEFLSGGLGLGLSISRAIAEKHGGTITVHSRVGEGSTFTLTLPKAVQE